MNTNSTSSASSSTTVAEVVQHDNAAILVQGLQVSFTIIEQLVVDRQVWQDTAFRTSNEQLYVLLQKCYQLYKDMGQGTKEADALRHGLNDYINLKGFEFKKSTHSLVKIVKCVFGNDRRRVRAYGLALRCALDKNITVIDLPSFIREAGGVEELRLSKAPNAMTATQKAKAAMTTLNTSTFGVLNSDKLGSLLDSGKVGTETVLIGTWQADGSVIVRAVVQSDGVLNAALASYYNSVKTEGKATAIERKAANDAVTKQDAIAAAVATASVGA